MPRFGHDPAGAALNLAKHGVSFDEARRVWDDPLAVVAYDRFEGGEHRWHAIGRVGPMPLVVTHAYPDEDDPNCVRLIGARRATRPERRRHEEAHDPDA